MVGIKLIFPWSLWMLGLIPLAWVVSPFWKLLVSPELSAQTTSRGRLSTNLSSPFFVKVGFGTICMNVIGPSCLATRFRTLSNSSTSQIWKPDRYPRRRTLLLMPPSTVSLSNAAQRTFMCHMKQELWISWVVCTEWISNCQNWNRGDGWRKMWRSMMCN